MTRERRTRLRCLDRAEPPQLIRLNMDSTTEADLARRAPDERHTVRVQALVDGLSAGLGADERNTTGVAGLGLGGVLVALTEVLDGDGLRRELDGVGREEPDDVPDPDDAHPAARDGLDVGEAPVHVCSDDGQDDLSNNKGTYESKGWALHEVQTCDEDKD